MNRTVQNESELSSASKFFQVINNMQANTLRWKIIKHIYGGKLKEACAAHLDDCVSWLLTLRVALGKYCRKRRA